MRSASGTRIPRLPRVVLAVDAQNMRHPTTHLDYARLQALCRQMGELVACAAFVSDVPEKAELTKFQLMLRATSYRVIRVRPLPNGHAQLKCNADVALAFWLGEALHTYRLRAGDVLVLCSGDADFVPIIEQLQARGIVVKVIAYRCCTSPHVQIIADEFYAIEEIEFLHRLEPDRAA